MLIDSAVGPIDDQTAKNVLTSFDIARCTIVPIFGNDFSSALCEGFRRISNLPSVL
jgi:hypothetical protein